MWGFPTLSPEEQEDVDGDSLLILRQMFLTTLMKQNCPNQTASFMEHPRDPVECSRSPSASRCSSLWATKAFRTWYPTVGHTLVKFDQCRLGQLVEKSTTISSDLDIQCWDGLRCNHPPHKSEDMQSSDLSRYPPPMMHGLAGAISRTLMDIGTKPSGPTVDWQSTTTRPDQPTPFQIPKVVSRDPTSDRPTSLPLSHRLSLMDEHVVVQLGFKTRPIRDGGGKPSAGRLVPPLRKATDLASMGKQVVNLTSEIHQAVQMSISCGEKSHPFSEALLNQIRQCLGSTNEDKVADGQPFYLTLISRLAKQAGDPIGNTPLLSKQEFQLGWMNRLSHHLAYGRQRRSSQAPKRNGKTSPPQWGDTTTTQQKFLQTPSRRPFWKKKRWASWRDHLPNKRQLRDVGANQVNSARDPWLPLTKETRCAQSMMEALAVPTPTFRRIVLRKLLHLQ